MSRVLQLIWRNFLAVFTECPMQPLFLINDIILLKPSDFRRWPSLSWAFLAVLAAFKATVPCFHAYAALKHHCSRRPNGYIQVSATGTGTITYQWYKNGSPISGATSSTYTTPRQSGDTGSVYTVTVTNSSGSSPALPRHLLYNFLRRQKSPAEFLKSCL